MKINSSFFFFTAPGFRVSLEINCVLGPAELIEFELNLELWCGKSFKISGIDASVSPEAMPGSALHRFEEHDAFRQENFADRAAGNDYKQEKQKDRRY